MTFGPQLAIIIGSQTGSRLGLYYAGIRLALKWLNWQIRYSDPDPNYARPRDYNSGKQFVFRVLMFILKEYISGGIIGAVLGLVAFRNMIRVDTIPYHLIDVLDA